MTRTRVLKWQLAAYWVVFPATVIAGDAGFVRLNSSNYPTVPVLFQDLVQWASFVCFVATVVLALVIAKNAWTGRRTLPGSVRIAAALVLVTTVALVCFLVVEIYQGLQALGNDDIAP
jgi:hypothetical protein